MPAYDLATLQAQWETLPTVRIWFGAEESGWAKALEAKVYCLANIPLTEGYNLYDVVTATRNKAGHLQIRTVLHRVLPQKAFVRYDKGRTSNETIRRYRRLVQAGREIGGSVEGLVAGYAGVALPPDVDVDAWIASLDIPGVGLLGEETEA